MDEEAPPTNEEAPPTLEEAPPGEKGVGGSGDAPLGLRDNEEPTPGCAPLGLRDNEGPRPAVEREGTLPLPPSRG